jgi:hypothetical protein
MADKEVLEMPLNAEPKVKRQPVNYLWSKLNWNFLKMLAEIAQYAEGKYGCAEQYMKARLEGQASPINHIYEHLRAFQAGEPHDRFGTVEHQLAAIAYNAMMEYAYVKMFGFVGNPVMPSAEQELRRHAHPVVEVAVTSPLSDALTTRETLAKTLPMAEAAPTTTTSTNWAEGLSHFRQRWQNGYEGTREPGAMRRFKAMLAALSQLDEIDLNNDAVLFETMNDIKKTAIAKLETSKTPESSEEYQATIAALDTLRMRIPEMFPKPAVEAQPEAI